MMLSLLSFALLLGLGTLLQGPLQPRELRLKSRSIPLWLLEAGLIATPFLLTLLLTQRLLLATLASLVLLITPIIVNHAKYRALREPLVFSDFYLYIQVFTHPRLFLPFLNIPLTLLAIVSGITALLLIVLLEQPLPLHPLPLAVGLVAVVWHSWYVAGTVTLQQLAVEDVQSLGLYNSLLISSLQAANPERRQALYQQLRSASPFQQPTVPKSAATQADILVVQSESFCDIRSISPAIRPEVLQHYDQLCQQAYAYGALTVPAWGANTLRTEFAFLSGVDNAELEHYRYNPYQFLQHQAVPTLASYLRQQGYYTLCIHPNHAEFFKRNRVFPNLGFDAFIDIEAFNPADTEGPYISDAAVTKKVLELLQHRPADKPLFMFVITMENHGPLHLEDSSSVAIDSLYQSPPPEPQHDLTVYLKHLQNADKMLKSLTDFLKQQPRETHLCWFGDHVPSMPDVYRTLNIQALDSHYLIWNNTQASQTSPSPEASKQPIESLAQTLLYSTGQMR